jgi:hypothetical protein
VHLPTFFARRLYPLLIAVWLFTPLSAGRLLAGQNADVDLGLSIVSSPCGLQSGDLVEFFVAARNMSAVRQVKFDLSWQPPDAVAAVTGAAAGIAEENHFIVPGPPQVFENRAEFGMASFGTGIDGEGILARFTFALASHIDAETPIDIRVDQLSMGPSSSERDNVRSPDMLVLTNYCDSFAQPLARGLFIRPQEVHADFSPTGTGAVVDGSSGEVQLSAHLLRTEGAFLPNALIVWTIENRGPAPLYILAAAGALEVPSGDVLEGPTYTDARGDAFLLLDAEPGGNASSSMVELKACGENAEEDLCASARVTWESLSTAVVGSASSLPEQLHLGQNYPNPFNASTTIPLSVPLEHTADLRLEIFDIAGQIVDVLHADLLPPGTHHLSWDVRNSRGSPLASGLYFYRLRSVSASQVRTMILLR